MGGEINDVDILSSQANSRMDVQSFGSSKVFKQCINKKVKLKGVGFDVTPFKYIIEQELTERPVKVKDY